MLRWIPLLLLFSTPVLSQQLPLLTEPASPLPTGTVQLEVAGSSLGDEPNYLTGLPRTTWAGPLLRLAYAPAESVELDVEWVVRVGQVDDPVYGSSWTGAT